MDESTKADELDSFVKNYSAVKPFISTFLKQNYKNLKNEDFDEAVKMTSKYVAGLSLLPQIKQVSSDEINLEDIKSYFKLPKDIFENPEKYIPENVDKNQSIFELKNTKVILNKNSSNLSPEDEKSKEILTKILEDLKLYELNIKYYNKQKQNYETLPQDVKKIIETAINNSKNPEVQSFLEKHDKYSEENKYLLSLFLAFAGNFKDTTREFYKSLGLQDYNFSEIYQIFNVGANYSEYGINYPIEFDKLQKDLLNKDIKSSDLKTEDLIEALQTKRVDLLIPENVKRNFEKNSFINIEYLNGRKEIKDQIVSQNDSFTYKKFFNNEFYLNMKVYGDVRKRGCLELITPKQDVRVNANYAHGAVSRKLYTAMYNEDYRNGKAEALYYTMDEADLALYKNNILIQTGDENAIIVFIPKQITGYQYDRMISSIDEIKKANPNAKFHAIRLLEDLNFGENYIQLKSEVHEDDEENSSNKLLQNFKIRKLSTDGTDYLYGNSLKKSIIDKSKEYEIENQNEEVIVSTTKENFYKSHNSHISPDSQGDDFLP